jgi:hypothetical protein
MQIFNFISPTDFRDGWGEREIKTTKIQYGGEICLTNVDEFNYILAPE